MSAEVLGLLGEWGGAGTPRSSWSSFCPPQVLLPTPGHPRPNLLPVAWGRWDEHPPVHVRGERPAHFTPALMGTPMQDHPAGTAAALALGESRENWDEMGGCLEGFMGSPRGKREVGG